MNISNLSTTQLNQIIAIKEQIEELQSQIESIADGGEIPSTTTEEAPAPAKRKYHITAAHKRKLIKALVRARKIRWARVRRAKKGTSRLLSAGSHYQDKGLYRQRKETSKRRLSAAGRAAISAAAKARWAKARAEGKTTL